MASQAAKMSLLSSSFFGRLRGVTYTPARVAHVMLLMLSKMRMFATDGDCICSLMAEGGMEALQACF
jgi:hypothetical protein